MSVWRTPPPPRGYTASKEQLVGRLRRIEGQVRGVQRMVDDDRYCIDVITQISAIQGALEKVALGLLDDHTRHCVLGPESGELREERTGGAGRGVWAAARPQLGAGPGCRQSRRRAPRGFVLRPARPVGGRDPRRQGRRSRAT